jgi:hypothetical protein
MVGVDARLVGKQMRLRHVVEIYSLSVRPTHRRRPSMNKFRVDTDKLQGDPEIEIARFFDRPMTCRLMKYVLLMVPRHDSSSQTKISS